MPEKATLLSVGSSPAVVFLCSRLQASRGYDISVAWPEISSPDEKYVVVSDKFGHGSFQPNHAFDSLDLASVKPVNALCNATEQRRSLDPRANAPTGASPSCGFDILLVSLSHLRQVSRIAKSLADVVIPNHTIILVDTSSGMPPLRNLFVDKFPDNPVMSIMLSDCRMFRTLGPNPTLVHKTSNTTTVLEFSALGLFSTSKMVSDLLFNLQSSGLDITKPQSRTAYLQSLWQRCIPTLAFGPLSIILDIADISKLQQDILARPIYQGVIAELLALARAQGCTMPDADYFGNEDLTRSLNMYNDFYNKLPIPVDVLLLQPILLADEFGLKSPYLESVFAFFSHLNVINSEDGKSALFQRVSAGSYDSCKEEAALWKREQTLLAKEQALAAREQALFAREQALAAREQAIMSGPQTANSVSNSGYIPPQLNSRRYRQPSVLSSVAGSPPGIKANEYTNGNSAQANGNHTGDIDMMSMTNRKSRRSLVRSPSVASSLSMSMPPPAPVLNGHRMSSPALSSMGFHGGPYSQNMDLDELIHSDDGRYGGLSNGLSSRSRRLSANISGPSPLNCNSSRSNSVAMGPTNSGGAMFSISPTAPANSRHSVANRLDGYAMNGHVNGNGMVNGNGNGYYKSSSSSPNSTPSTGSK